jgi:hypothetical protein
MSKTDDKLSDQAGETLRPANSRAVRWSFGLGLAMLAALAVVSHLYAVN